MISFNSLRIPAEKLVGPYQGNKLTISQRGFFFFEKLEDFFLFIGPPALPVTSIHFSDTGKRLEYSVELGLNDFIKHFVSGISLPMSTIYLGLDG